MRSPAVAGTFYPSDKEPLIRMLEAFDSQVPEIDVTPISGISPHAGYVYSGLIATHTFKAMKNSSPKTLIIVGPDHVGIASSKSEIAVYPDGEWETPLGTVKVNEKLAQKIVESLDYAYPDKEAHEMEHSIEVQLPFAQYFLEKFTVVPIMMGDQSLETAIMLGKALARVAKDAFVLASSDMSHYVAVDEARKNDLYALEALINMDAGGFYQRLIERKVSACGYGPMTVAMTFARELGASKGRLLSYGTSSDVTGDPVCVGYASVIFE